MSSCFIRVLPFAAPRRLRWLSAARLAGVAAAVLTFSYLGCVVADQQGQLLPQRHGAREVREEIPDARPLVRVIVHG